MLAVISTRGLAWPETLMAHLIAGAPFYLIIAIILHGFLDIPKAFRYILYVVPVVAVTGLASLVSPWLFAASLVLTPILLFVFLGLWSRGREGTVSSWRKRRFGVRRWKNPPTEKTARILGKPGRRSTRDKRGRFLRPMREAKAKVKMSRLIIYD
ncbi:MAG: hypothetical protein ACYTFG_12760 [Planctomycetota bacterium]|jgi:hypothetical protein